MPLKLLFKNKQKNQHNALFQPIVCVTYLFKVYASCCWTCCCITCVWTQVTIKVNVFIQKNLYPIQNYVQISIETACSQIDFPSFLMFCLGYFKFLASITVRLVLGFNMLNNIIQNNSRPKPNYNSLFPLENHVTTRNKSLWRHKMPKLQQLLWRELNISIKKVFDKPISFDVKV